MALSCLLLAYTAYVVPMQLSFWITDDLCNPFPTLYSDVLVDTYFMVRFCSAGAVDWLIALEPSRISCSIHFRCNCICPFFNSSWFSTYTCIGHVDLAI